MKNLNLKIYLINVINILLICFIVQIITTIFLPPIDNNASFTGINIWFWFILFLTYKTCKYLKTDLGKFLISFFICFIILFIIEENLTIFSFLKPSYFGASHYSEYTPVMNILYDSFPLNFKDLKEFLFWQTGSSSGYYTDMKKSNFLISFFTIPPVALFECLIKSIFPNLFILLILQVPLLIHNRNFLSWKSKKLK